MPTIEENIRYVASGTDSASVIMLWDSSTNETLNGYSYEVALTYSLKSFAVSVGYKIQVFDYDWGGESEYKGVTFGVDYMFQ